MPRCIAFLRAINVAGRFIKMEALAGHFRTLGHQEVSTFINTGNVLFSGDAPDLSVVESATEVGLAVLLGFQSEVYLRSPAQLAALTSRTAALRLSNANALEVNVAFLKDPLTPLQHQTLLTLQSEVDALHYAPDEREFYWVCQVKQSDSRLTNAVLERQLKLRTTLRRATMLAKLATQIQAAA